MNTLRAPFVTAVLLVWILASAQAQINADKAAQQSPKVSGAAAQPSPVRIAVTRSYKWQHEAEKKTTDSGKSNRRSSKSGSMVPKIAAVRYDIRVSNKSVKALGEVQIKWAVLIHGDDVKEGQSDGKLGIGGDLSAKTEIIPIEKESDVSGYFVEVVAGGQVIATEQDPKGIKERIESNKKSESKSRHKKKSDDPPPAK